MTGVWLIVWSGVGLLVLGWVSAGITSNKLADVEAALAAETKLRKATEVAHTAACLERDRLRDSVRALSAEVGALHLARGSQSSADDCNPFGMPSVADRAAGIEVAS